VASVSRVSTDAPAAARRLVVLKVGGTSVADVAGWPGLGRLLEARRDHELLQPLLVCSALAGVTDLLARLPDAALEGAPSAGEAAGGGATEAVEILDALGALHHRWVDAALSGGDAEAGGGSSLLQLPPAVDEELAVLARIAEGVALVGEVSPRLRARVLAAGERMSTHLVVAWLQRAGIGAVWVDARGLLPAETPPTATPERRYLSATVSATADPDARRRLDEQVASATDVVVTQGFVARDEDGDTVVLGRGGSDTSASLLAARLGAVRVEIWTDVPGMFSANPHAVPQARLLRQLDYAEAQEIASTGAKVLHPACLLPVRLAQIPLEIRCTHRPDWPHTTICDGGAVSPGVKAVSMRSGMVLVSMETVGMWQEVGFLARAFGVFAGLGLSIDLVATSETSVTVSLDPRANVVDGDQLALLQTRLSAFCEARVLPGVASVSLVGRHIRSILHRLAGVFELFEEQRIHLVSQAASDLNLTVVVDEEQAPRLVSQLHARLFGELEIGEAMGPTWAALTAPASPEVPSGEPAGPESATPSSRGARAPWWVDRRGELLSLVASQGSPLYAMSRGRIEEAARGLGALHSVEHVLFAMKANPDPAVLQVAVEAGLGLECVSPGELALARAALGPTGGPLLFTPNFAPIDDYVAGFAHGARVTLDNVHPLASHPEVFAGREVFLRIDPGRGAGHHKHVRTAGAVSKFGIPQAQLGAVAQLCGAHQVRVVGLHSHVGSGVRDPEAWPRVARVLAAAARAHFPDVKVLDLGGGLGVPEKRGHEPMDLAALDAALAAFHAESPGFAVWLEPGRFVVSEAGVLLTRVTQLKDKGPHHRYVGVDAGMHTLIRPALYGAWHEIHNLSRWDQPGPWIEADVVGPICESGDVLGHGRRLVEPAEGDVLLVATAGAYGAAMSSDYNSRPRAPQLLID